MTTNNPHLGSTFESWLEVEGIHAEATTSAIKAVIALQITQAMKTNGITKVAMAEQMHTSRAQLNRLLDPHNNSVTLDTLQRAAKIVGRELRLELV